MTEYTKLIEKLQRPCNYIVQRPGDRWAKVDIYDIQEAISALSALDTLQRQLEAAVEGIKRLGGCSVCAKQDTAECPSMKCCFQGYGYWQWRGVKNGGAEG